jgi:hypothetical protein
MSPIANAPRQALAMMMDVRVGLEAQLKDRSSSGRIPRAVLGRYLRWLFYFGEDWLKAHMSDLFPVSDESLRRSAWLGHLLYDQGPIADLTPQLTPIYTGEIDQLTGEKQDREVESHQNRLGEYLISLYLADALPEGMIERFLRYAPSRLRRHVMWSLGVSLQTRPNELPEPYQARARLYWEARLNAAARSPDPDAFR